MKKTYYLIALVVFGTTALMAQQPDPISIGLGGVATVVGETHSPEVEKENAADTAVAQVALKPVPVWKQKLYYGYNFDIYYHSDSRPMRKENGWSISLEPEIGWRVNEKISFGLRLAGNYQDTYETYTIDLTNGSSVSEGLRIQQGGWSVTPYGRYRLKSMFNDKLGIWIEAHLYGGMEYPRVTDGDVKGTDYDGLRYSVNYGFQVSPVITYQFNRKRNFQIFFSILSLGFSGTSYFYEEPETGRRYQEHTQDIIIFSGKLKNMLANQFTPGLYGLKFGVQKSF